MEEKNMVPFVQSSMGRRKTVSRWAALVVLMALITGVVPAFALNDSLIPLGSSFNSSFNGSKAGWSSAHGTWKLTPTGKYKGVAENGLYVSAVHKDAYNDFMFSARMKKAGTGALFLLFRGDPTNVVGDQYMWDTGYVAAFSNAGNVALQEMFGGVPSLVGLDTAGPVVVDGWNTLKVVAYGQAIGMYLNGEPIGKVYDNTYSFGNVGFGFFDDSTPDNMLVDWAKLTVISGDTNPFAADFSTFKIQGDDRVVSPYEAFGR
jgi:hypothetical protein